MNGCSQSIVSSLIFVLMNRTKQTSKPTSKQSAHKKASIDEAFAQLLPNLLPVTVDAVPAKVAPNDALLNFPEARTMNRAWHSTEIFSGSVHAIPGTTEQRTGGINL